MRARDEYALTPLAHSVLLPLPEIPPGPSASHDDGSSNMFKNFRRLGLTYLDENGEELEFSAGTVLDDDKGDQSQSEETGAITSECSDSESDATGIDAERPIRCRVQVGW